MFKGLRRHDTSGLSGCADARLQHDKPRVFALGTGPARLPGLATCGVEPRRRRGYARDRGLDCQRRRAVTALVAFFRVLLALFLFRLLFRFVSGLLAGYRGQGTQREAPPAGVPMVRDRVCDTFVPRERALSAMVNGHEEYFCSERCYSQALRAAGAGSRAAEP
jgi:YHS domain-containing protein